MYACVYVCMHSQVYVCRCKYDNLVVRMRQQADEGACRNHSPGTLDTKKVSPVLSLSAVVVGAGAAAAAVTTAAVSFLIRFVQADVRIFNAAINACAQAGEAVRALLLFQGMPERGLVPDTITYNALINVPGNRLEKCDSCFWSTILCKTCPHKA